MESDLERLHDLFHISLPDIYIAEEEKRDELSGEGPRNDLGEAQDEVTAGEGGVDGRGETGQGQDGGKASSQTVIDGAEATGADDRDKSGEVLDVQDQGDVKESSSSSALAPDVEEELRLRLEAVEEKFSSEAKACDRSVAYLERALTKAKNLDDAYQNKADELHTPLQRQTSLPLPPSFLSLEKDFLDDNKLVDSRSLLLKWENHKNALVAPPEAVQFNPEAEGGIINTTFVKEESAKKLPTRFAKTTIQSLTSPSKQTKSSAKSPRQRGELLPTQFVPPKWKHGEKMSAAQHELEFKLLKKMKERLCYLRNPRFDDVVTMQKRASVIPSRALLTSNKDIDIVVEPSTITFDSYAVDCIHEKIVHIRNVSTVSRRLRLLPIESQYFSISKVMYPSVNGYVAPGMHCKFTIKFQPDSLGDYRTELKVVTDIRRYSVDIIAHRKAPCLSLPKRIELGKCLVGHKMRTVLTCQNSGGDGTFVIMGQDQLAEHISLDGDVKQLKTLKETHEWLTDTFQDGIPRDRSLAGTALTTSATTKRRRLSAFQDYVADTRTEVYFGDNTFTVSPRCFHLGGGETIDIVIDFEPRSQQLSTIDMPILSDDCKINTFILEGDAVKVNVEVTDISDRQVMSSTTSSSQNGTTGIDKTVPAIWFGKVSPFEHVVRRVTVMNQTPIDLPFEWRMFDYPVEGYHTTNKSKSSHQADSSTNAFEEGIVPGGDDANSSSTGKTSVFRIEPNAGVMMAQDTFTFDFCFSPDLAVPSFGDEKDSSSLEGRFYKQMMSMFVDTELGYKGQLIDMGNETYRMITRSSKIDREDDEDDDEDASASFQELPLNLSCVSVPVEGCGVYYDVHLSQSLVRFCGELNVGNTYSKTIYITNGSGVPAEYSIPQSTMSAIHYSPSEGVIPAFGSIPLTITVSPMKTKNLDTRGTKHERDIVETSTVNIHDGNSLELVVSYRVALLTLTFGEVMLNFDNIKLHRTKSTSLYIRNDNSITVDYCVHCQHPDISIDENEVCGTLPPNSDYETVNITVYGNKVGILEDLVTVYIRKSEPESVNDTTTTATGKDVSDFISNYNETSDNEQQISLMATIFMPQLILDNYIVDIGTTYVGEVSHRKIKIKNIAKVSSVYEWVVPDENQLPKNIVTTTTHDNVKSSSIAAPPNVHQLHHNLIECSPPHGYLLCGEVDEMMLTVTAGTTLGECEIPVECVIGETDQVLGIVLKMRVQAIEVKFSVLSEEQKLAFQNDFLNRRRKEEETSGERGGGNNVGIDFGTECAVGQRYQMYLAIENLTKVKTKLSMELEEYSASVIASQVPPNNVGITTSGDGFLGSREGGDGTMASLANVGTSTGKHTLQRPSSQSQMQTQLLRTRQRSANYQPLRLSASHEKSAPFSCDLGKKLINHRVIRSDNQDALSDGKGLAIALHMVQDMSDNDVGLGGDDEDRKHELLPRQSVLVRLTCFCSMPGEYVTSLQLRVGNLDPIYVPIRIGIVGTPLVLRSERLHITGYENLEAHREFNKLNFGSSWKNFTDSSMSAFTQVPPVAKDFYVANTGPFDIEVTFDIKYKKEGKEDETIFAHVDMQVNEDDDDGPITVNITESVDEKVSEFTVDPKCLQLKAGGEACVTATFSSDEAGLYRATVFGKQRVINNNTDLKLKLWNPDIANTLSSSPLSSTESPQIQEIQEDDVNIKEESTTSSSTPDQQDGKEETVEKSDPHLSVILSGGFHAYGGVPHRPLDTLTLDLEAVAESQYLDVEDSLDFVTHSIHGSDHHSHFKSVTLTNNFNASVSFTLDIEGEHFSINKAVPSVEQINSALYTTEKQQSTKNLSQGTKRKGKTLVLPNFGSIPRFELPPRQNIQVTCKFLPKTSKHSQPYLFDDYTVKGKLRVDFGNENPQILPIIASVCHPAVIVTPTIADFGTVHSESARTMTITISNPTRSDASWHILSGLSENNNNNGSSQSTNHTYAEHHSFSNGDDSNSYNNNGNSSDSMSNYLSGSTTSSTAMDDIFSVWPKRGRIRGCGYGQPFTQDLKVTFRPRKDVHYSKLISFIVDKGRGCEITLRGRGTYDERIEAIIQ